MGVNLGHVCAYTSAARRAMKISMFCVCVWPHTHDQLTRAPAAGAGAPGVDDFLPAPPRAIAEADGRRQAAPTKNAAWALLFSRHRHFTL